MHYLDLWKVDDGGFLLLSPEVIKVFEKYAQVDSTMPESGGILLGYVRGQHLEIIEATEPTSADKRRMFFFLRRPQGHQEIARRQWDESQGLIRYLGEWHTHPENVPLPSCLDRREWRNSASKRADGRSQVGLIVGREDLHIELTYHSGKYTVCRKQFESEHVR
ncbi:Mov34/MPN/PAD-1 family protein [Janthinobacterium lividum]|nr:Mov34/MPN/PAD-1 family protein [Janthinobacterium lividum]